MKTSLYKDDLTHLFSICKDHKKDDQLSRLYVVFFSGSAYACALNGHTMGAYKLCNECIEIDANQNWSISFSELSDLIALKQERVFFIYEDGELRAESGRVSIQFKQHEYGPDLGAILGRASSYFSDKNLTFSECMSYLPHSYLDLVLPPKRKNGHYVLQKDGDATGMQIFVPDDNRYSQYIGICMPCRIENPAEILEQTTARGREFFNIA